MKRNTISKHKGETPQLLYKRDIRKIEADACYKSQILMFAFLMDELDYDKEKIIECKKAMDRYLESIDQKLITVKDVEKIIKDYTELEIVRK